MTFHVIGSIVCPHTDICRLWVVLYNTVGTSAEGSVFFLLSSADTLSANAINMCSRIERFAGGSESIGGFPMIGTTLLSHESWYRYLVQGAECLGVLETSTSATTMVDAIFVIAWYDDICNVRAII